MARSNRRRKSPVQCDAGVRALVALAHPEDLRSSSRGEAPACRGRVPRAQGRALPAAGERGEALSPDIPTLTPYGQHVAAGGPVGERRASVSALTRDRGRLPPVSAIPVAIGIRERNVYGVRDVSACAQLPHCGVPAVSPGRICVAPVLGGFADWLLATIALVSLSLVIDATEVIR